MPWRHPRRPNPMNECLRIVANAVGGPEGTVSMLIVMLLKCYCRTMLMQCARRTGAGDDVFDEARRCRLSPVYNTSTSTTSIFSCPNPFVITTLVSFINASSNTSASASTPQKVLKYHIPARCWTTLITVVAVSSPSHELTSPSRNQACYHTRLCELATRPIAYL